MNKETKKYSTIDMPMRVFINAKCDGDMSEVENFDDVWFQYIESISGKELQLKIKDEKEKEKLEKEDIETRRLFYPSLSSALPYLTPKEFPITDDISKRVLSLPFYFDLKMEEVQRIVNIIKEELC